MTMTQTQYRKRFARLAPRPAPIPPMLPAWNVVRDYRDNDAILDERHWGEAGSHILMGLVNDEWRARMVRIPDMATVVR